MKKPLYIQISEEFKNMISEEYQYGSLFPPERELSEKYKIDRKTVRKALNILVEEHLLVRVMGKGTYVKRPDINMPMNKLIGFSRMIRQEGGDLTTEVLELSENIAGYKLAKIFEIGQFDSINRLERVRYVDKVPVAIEITYVPQIIPNFQKMDFGISSLYETFVENNHIPTDLKEEVEAIKIFGKRAKLLGVDEGTAVFLVTDITKDQNGKVIEYNNTYSCSDRIKMSTQLV
ncbi:MAG: GntR family transcriptional regulator [Herbinix sp.]|nr:GntR family transcriptional regulator [Herbinix sp.]